MVIGVAISPLVILAPAAGATLGVVGGAGITSAVSAAIASGPIGWISLGNDGKSWDCWRVVLHDFESYSPRGRLLKDVAADPRVKEIRTETKEGHWPQYWLKNEWNEEFRIDYVQLSDGEIAAHAVRIEP